MDNITINEQIEQLLQKFREYFGTEAAGVYSSPGRTEIGGNHTDHQNGRVLAAAIDRDILAAAAPAAALTTEAAAPATEVAALAAGAGTTTDCSPGLIEIYSEGFGTITVDLTEEHALEPRPEESGTAAALIRGTLASLSARGWKIGGCRLYMRSRVPAGSGLSSSAAFETLIGTIQADLYNEMAIPPTELALAGQQAETEYFGKPCGLMDQMACACGGLVYIDFKAPAEPAVETLDLDLAGHGLRLCITDTGSSHADLTGEYAAIPEEMRKVAAMFGRERLGDLTAGELLAQAGRIRRACGDRAFLRALHYTEETARAAEEAAAVKAGDMGRFLKLVRRSGSSSFRYLQNVYRPGSSSEQPLAAALAASESFLAARAAEDRWAVRVHGGGFAGTIQAFLPAELVEEYRGLMDSMFGEGACQCMDIRSEGSIRLK